jgi:hypothetical protein
LTDQPEPSKTYSTQQRDDLLSPKTGTATSSPVDNTTSQSDMKIVNTMLWMKKNAYKETTIRKVSKFLRHLQRNCNTKDPETVKLYIAKKNTSNGQSPSARC